MTHSLCSDWFRTGCIDQDGFELVMIPLPLPLSAEIMGTGRYNPVRIAYFQIVILGYENYISIFKHHPF